MDLIYVKSDFLPLRGLDKLLLLTHYNNHLTLQEVVIRNLDWLSMDRIPKEMHPNVVPTMNQQCEYLNVSTLKMMVLFCLQHCMLFSPL